MRADLTPEQEDGVACVVCGDIWGACIPVGYSRTGAQVFACVPCADFGDVEP